MDVGTGDREVARRARAAPDTIRARPISSSTGAAVGDRDLALRAVTDDQNYHALRHSMLLAVGTGERGPARTALRRT